MTQEKELKNSDIILGKDISNVRRGLAFFSVALIYFFYCYNFMVGTFIKPTMITEAVNGGFGFTLKQSEEIFAVMSFGTIPGTFLFGMLSTRIGKKKTLIGIALLIALTTYIPLLSPTNMVLWKAARFCTGVVMPAIRIFDEPRDLISDHMAHAAHHEAGIHHRDGDAIAHDRPRTADDGLMHARRRLALSSFSS